VSQFSISRIAIGIFEIKSLNDTSYPHPASGNLTDDVRFGLMMRFESYNLPGSTATRSTTTPTRALISVTLGTTIGFREGVGEVRRRTSLSPLNWWVLSVTTLLLLSDRKIGDVNALLRSRAVARNE
jgi:hypothetical protein